MTTSRGAAVVCELTCRCLSGTEDAFVVRHHGIPGLPARTRRRRRVAAASQEYVQQGMEDRLRERRHRVRQRRDVARVGQCQVLHRVAMAARAQTVDDQVGAPTAGPHLVVTPADHQKASLEVLHGQVRV